MRPVFTEKFGETGNRLRNYQIALHARTSALPVLLLIKNHSEPGGPVLSWVDTD